jgi:hypothetical protein
MLRNWHQIVLICRRLKNGSEIKKNTQRNIREVPSGGCLALIKKLMKRRETKNNQVYLVYGVCNQSYGFERLPTVRDLQGLAP